MNDFKIIQETAKGEIPSIDHLLPHFVRVTDIDDSPDLTDVHPRDRTDLHLFFIPVDEKLFPNTAKLIKENSNITSAAILGFAPNSQLYPHVDTVDLLPYAEVDWLSVFMGLYVPSYDTDLVAVKIGDTVHSHQDIIIFDAQVPHLAWNKTNEWWISIRLSILKSAFI